MHILHFPHLKAVPFHLIHDAVLFDVFLFTFNDLCPLLGCSQLGNGRPELCLCYQSILRLWGLNCISFPSAEGSNPLSSNQLRKKPCKYFEQGKGTCPFGGKCLYLHAYPDGTRAEPEKPRKQLSSEGTVRVRSVQHLISGSPVLLGSVSCRAGQVKKASPSVPSGKGLFLGTEGAPHLTAKCHCFVFSTSPSTANLSSQQFCP